MHTKANVCIYGISSDTVFNNSVIATCKLFHGSRSSQQEEQFERWSSYRHLKMNNNFSARTICRGVKIFSIACKQSLPLPRLLCAEICSRYWQKEQLHNANSRHLDVMSLHEILIFSAHVYWYFRLLQNIYRWSGGNRHSEYITYLHKFPNWRGSFSSRFLLCWVFVMNHNSGTSALNQYKAPRQQYLCLIIIWLESLEMSS